MQKGGEVDSKVRNMRLRLKWSKYRLAKEMGVSWNTVHLWDMGIWEPNKENAQKLEGLFTCNNQN